MKPKLWTIQYSLVVFMTFLFFLCLHMLNAGFPVFITGLTQSPVQGGMMMTAFMLAAIFSRPIVSAFLHQIQMKKVIMLTLVMIFLCVFFSLNLESFPLLLFIRVLEGAGFGVVTTILATMATTIIPRERLGEGVGFFGLATSLGASLSPVIAISIIHSYSFNLVLWMALLIIVLMVCITMFLTNVSERLTSDHNERQKERVSYFEYVYDKNAFLPSILVFFLCVTFAGVFNFIGGLGQQTNLEANVGLFFVVFMVIMLFIRPVTGKIFDRMGHKVLIYPAGICGVIGLILLSITENLIILTISAVFYALAYGALHPTLQAWAVSRVEASKKGTANAMVLTFMDLAMAVGAPILGMIAGFTGYKVMFGLSSMFMIGLLVIYILLGNAKQTLETRKSHSM